MHISGDENGLVNLIKDVKKTVRSIKEAFTTNPIRL